MQSITAQQSRDARRELGLSQADVTKALGFNRQYISEWETGHSSRLTNTQLKKLRSFYEEKITEENASGETITLTFGADTSEKPPGAVENYTAKRITFPVADGVPDEVFVSTLDTISGNDKRLVELLTSTIVRDGTMFDSSELSQATLEALREGFSRLAANYLLIRSLTGWPQLGLAASNINPATDSILGLVMGEVNESFLKSGLLTESKPDSEGDEE